jgi:hypothetical protein
MDILKKFQIIDYHRYVDDILIIYNTHTTNISDTLEEFNKIHLRIKFIIEEELNNKINFLDISITKTHTKLQLGIYRKHTTTDLLIHNDSCHPHEHKKAAINFLINRMNKYPIIHNKNNEETIIKTILNNNNNYPQNTIQQKQKPSKKNSEQTRKWATFTFFRPETRTVTKLFKNTKIGISYRTKNNIKHLLRTKENNGKYNQSGVYQ